MNRATALWGRPRREITEEEYEEFYKHVAHDFEAPLDTIHAQVEGNVEYTVLLFVPGRAPFDLWDRNVRRGLRLYVRRVFILEDAGDLLPAYLRFMRGVIDSSDLPLNVSREILQSNRQVEAIRSGTVKRVLGALDKLAEGDAEKYAKFWGEFGKVLKEGVVEDASNRDAIAALLRFHSTADEDGEPAVSLAAYVERMNKGQEAIHYLTADSLTAARSSPHLEVFRKQGVEVLLLTDPVDEWLVGHLTEFDGKPLRSVSRGDLDLASLGEGGAAEGEGAGEGEDAGEEETGKDGQDAAEAAGDREALVKRIGEALGDRVQSARVSRRLTTSPACLVADEHALGTHFENVLRAAGHDVERSKPILEVNVDHPIVGRMSDQEGDRFADWAQILHDQALLSEGGQLEDPAGFVRRLNDMFQALAGESDGGRRRCAGRRRRLNCPSSPERAWRILPIPPETPRRPGRGGAGEVGRPPTPGPVERWPTDGSAGRASRRSRTSCASGRAGSTRPGSASRTAPTTRSTRPSSSPSTLCTFRPARRSPPSSFMPVSPDVNGPKSPPCSTGASRSGSPPRISPARRGSRGSGSRSTGGCWCPGPRSRSSSRKASTPGSTVVGCGASSTSGPGADASRSHAPMPSPARGWTRSTFSPAALDVARRNVALHDLEGRVRVVESDLFGGLDGESNRRAGARYDLVVSNPPYVPDEEMAGLPPEFRAEPASALTGGPDGLDVVGRIVEEAPRWLAPEGALVVEVGASPVVRAALESRFDLPFVWLDAARGGRRRLPAAPARPLTPLRTGRAGRAGGARFGWRLLPPGTGADRNLWPPGRGLPAREHRRGPQRPRGQDGCLPGVSRGRQEKSIFSINTLTNIMFLTLFLSRRYAASQRKSRTPKSKKIHDPSRKKSLRSPLRHLRQDRQRPRPVRGRVRRPRTEPAGHAPQVRRPLQNLGEGHLPQRHQEQRRPRVLPRGYPRHGPRARASRASGAPACATTSCRALRESASTPSPPPTS